MNDLIMKIISVKCTCEESKYPKPKPKVRYNNKTRKWEYMIQESKCRCPYA